MAKDHSVLLSRTFLVCAVGCLVVSNLVFADRVARLVKILLTDDSYKVRLQAAITLGKLKRPSAVEGLGRALRDSHYTVRGVAAAALGQIADPGAGGALRQLLRREKHPFVRKQVQKALKAISKASAPIGADEVLLFVRTIRNESKLQNGQIVEIFRSSLLEAFRQAKDIHAAASVDQRLKNRLLRHKIKGYVLDGSIKISSERATSGVKFSCATKLILSTYPANSMKAFYNGSASTTVSSGSMSPSRQLPIVRDLLKSSASAAEQYFLKHLIQAP